MAADADACAETCVGGVGTGSEAALAHGTCVASGSGAGGAGGADSGTDGTDGTGGREAAAEDVAFHGWTTGCAGAWDCGVTGVLYVSRPAFVLIGRMPSVRSNHVRFISSMLAKQMMMEPTPKVSVPMTLCRRSFPRPAHPAGAPVSTRTQRTPVRLMRGVAPVRTSLMTTKPSHAKAITPVTMFSVLNASPDIL